MSRWTAEVTLRTPPIEAADADVARAWARTWVEAFFWTARDGNVVEIAVTELEDTDS